MKFTREIQINPFFDEVFVLFKLQLHRNTFTCKVKHLEGNQFELCEGETLLCEQVERYMDVSNEVLAIIDSLPELNDGELIEAFIELEKALLEPVQIERPNPLL
ncbi:hypothetical protein [Kurthia sibirica]|uniref:Uncharacterized protein n=1 Tax=Kurthia sibirica TaxID=202750 RepID=A0A2U3AH04_9BACL|nr:hypothetical protein [Kurthia sibirica]PWI23741.1 hypothetical protein DEX24_15725 [Kurthia sibirica]GEK35563.1 hypothetical protein KSI01_30960 [Kurthia sibirica]